MRSRSLHSSPYVNTILVNNRRIQAIPCVGEDTETELQVLRERLFHDETRRKKYFQTANVILTYSFVPLNSNKLNQIPN